MCDIKSGLVSGDSVLGDFMKQKMIVTWTTYFKKNDTEEKT